MIMNSLVCFFENLSSSLKVVVLNGLFKLQQFSTKEVQETELGLEKNGFECSYHQTINQILIVIK